MIYLLLGLIGAGKSAVGKKLAEKLDYDFVEFDKTVLERSGFESVQSVYDYRKSFWKECELKQSKYFSHQKDLIIAMGGGVIENDLNFCYFRENAKQDFEIVYLYASPEVLTDRVYKKGTIKKENDKNLLDRIKGLHDKRDLLFKDEATYVIDTSELTVAETVKQILDRKQE